MHNPLQQTCTLQCGKKKTPAPYYYLINLLHVDVTVSTGGSTSTSGSTSTGRSTSTACPPALLQLHKLLAQTFVLTAELRFCKLPKLH
jgi:hypothetical protein